MVITRPNRSCLLTVDGGSSSLKFALFPLDGIDRPRPLRSGRIERIGLARTRATLANPTGGESESSGLN
jgi:acetate kinase